MTLNLNVLMPAIVAATMLVSSGVTPDGVERVQVGAGGVDVCAVLPRDEAIKVLGSKMLRAQPAQTSEGATECRYSDALGTVSVLVETGISRARFEESMKQLAEVGGPLVPAGGVGDSGYFWDARLYTYAAKYRIVVNTSWRPGMDEAKARANAVALAKVLIARLK